MAYATAKRSMPILPDGQTFQKNQLPPEDGAGQFKAMQFSMLRTFRPDSSNQELYYRLTPGSQN